MGSRRSAALRLDKDTIGIYQCDSGPARGSRKARDLRAVQGTAVDVIARPEHPAARRPHLAMGGVATVSVESCGASPGAAAGSHALTFNSFSLRPGRGEPKRYAICAWR